MHDDSCITINYAHTHVITKCFQVTSHIVGFCTVLHVVNFNSYRCNHLLNFDLYANSLLSSHCENGLLRCCLYKHQTDISYLCIQVSHLQLQIDALRAQVAASSRGLQCMSLLLFLLAFLMASSAAEKETWI